MLLNNVYFRLKPLIPRPIRLGIRRWFVLRKRRQVEDVWPIMPGSECAPNGWPGWPDGKKFALVLTHDVESERGIENCRQLAELEQRLGFRSSFNFVPEGSYKVPAVLRTWLTDRGFEVGVHDLHHDGQLYSSREEFNRKAQRINEVLKEWGAVGFRSGYMLRNLEWLKELDIAYDASTFDTDPFEPQPDGVETIFPFWDHSSGKRKGHVELPYTMVQDSTLFLLLGEKNIQLWKRKLDWIAGHQGMVLLNVHPDYIDFSDSSGSSQRYPIARYRELLDYVRDRYDGSFWHALPREVAAYCASFKPEHPRRAGAGRSVPFGNTPKYPFWLGWASLLEAAAGPARRRLKNPRMSRSAEGAPSSVDSMNDSLQLAGKRAVAVVFSNYPADPRPRRAAEALEKEGMHLEVICLKETDHEPERETFNGVEITRIPLKRRRGGKLTYIAQYGSFVFLSGAILAARACRRRYDLVHIHNMPDFLVFSALVPKIFGARVILDQHDPMPELMMTIFGLREESSSVRILKVIEKCSLAFADAVLTVNQACKKIFSARSCRSEKVSVIMNSPDADIFQYRAASPETLVKRDASKPFVIMYHGSLVERHGLDLAVTALGKLKKSVPNAELRVYGRSTPYLEQVMDSARKSPLHDAVRYLGPKKLEQIVEAIGESDVGVIPNRRSIFTELNTPTRIFEYLSQGKPVIAPRAPGILDYFGPEELILFDLGNADDLAAKIEYVFTHPDEISRIVERGQEVYRAHAWSAERQRFVNLTDQLLKGTPPSTESAQGRPAPVLGGQE